MMVLVWAALTVLARLAALQLLTKSVEAATSIKAGEDRATAEKAVAVGSTSGEKATADKALAATAIKAVAAAS